MITRPTRLQGLLRKRATLGVAKFSLEQVHAHERLRRQQDQPDNAARQQMQQIDMAASFAEYEDEDETYRLTLRRLKTDLELGHPVTFVDRDFVPNFDFSRCLVVVVVGPDGLVANAAKYVGEVPIVGINPDPRRNDGVLLPFLVSDARQAVRQALRRQARIKHVTLAQATLNDGQKLLAFNDLFIGCRTHTSARYTLRSGRQAEVQSSSGILVSTGAGSTGWLSSLFNMYRGLARSLGQEPPPLRSNFDWSERRLIWAVREPFVSRHSSAEMVTGAIAEGSDLVIESITPSDGVIFSDGVEQDYLEFNSGAIARISVSARRAQLVIPG